MSVQNGGLKEVIQATNERYEFNEGIPEVLSFCTGSNITFISAKFLDLTSCFQGICGPLSVSNDGSSFTSESQKPT